MTPVSADLYDAWHCTNERVCLFPKGKMTALFCGCEERFPPPKGRIVIEKGVFFMSKTSDTPDANEQVKATKTRSRTTARTKTESATPDSQAQEEKPTVQRRTAPATRATTAVRTQSTTSEKGNTQATPEARPATKQPTNARTARPTTTHAASTNATRSTTAQQAPTNVVRPATTGPATPGTARPATKVVAADGSRSSATQRSEPGQRSGGAASTVQRQASNATAQRTAVPGSTTTRPGTRPGGTSHGT